MTLPVFIEQAARSELDERLTQLSLINPTAAGLRNDVASLLDRLTAPTTTASDSIPPTAALARFTLA